VFRERARDGQRASSCVAVRSAAGAAAASCTSTVVTSWASTARDALRARARTVRRSALSSSHAPIGPLRSIIYRGGEADLRVLEVLASEDPEKFSVLVVEPVE
jgi:hypothetical protein